jgi:hypothetical protein
MGERLEIINEVNYLFFLFISLYLIDSSLSQSFDNFCFWGGIFGSQFKKWLFLHEK